MKNYTTTVSGTTLTLRDTSAVSILNMPKRQPYRKPAAMDLRQEMLGVVLEHQEGMYRVFHVRTGQLLHSHECKAEVVRRAERDGWIFGLVVSK